jgi:hypothetical protein
MNKARKKTVRKPRTASLALAPCSPFRVGQWVWSEHKLKIVKEIRNGHVTELSDGYCSCSYSNLDDVCFPLDVRGKLISEEYERSYSLLHKESRGLNLNFPDIHRWYVAEWCEAMKQRDNDAAIKAAYERLRAFEREIIDGIEDAKRQTAGGLSLFRN